VASDDVEGDEDKQAQGSAGQSMRTKLNDHPITKQLEKCDSVDSISSQPSCALGILSYFGFTDVS
jgi:hypothetical protein